MDRTKAERKADEASQEVRKLEYEGADPEIVRQAKDHRDKAWRAVQQIRGSR